MWPEMMTENGFRSPQVLQESEAPCVVVLHPKWRTWVRKEFAASLLPRKKVEEMKRISDAHMAEAGKITTALWNPSSFNYKNKHVLQLDKAYIACFCTAGFWAGMQ